jgi:hypothetical protein
MNKQLNDYNNIECKSSRKPNFKNIKHSQIKFYLNPSLYSTQPCFTKPVANMSTPVPAAPTNLSKLTYRDVALQAATAANPNSFSVAYKPTPTKAERLTETFNKNYPDTSRLANICDSGLTMQFAILVKPIKRNPSCTQLPISNRHQHYQQSSLCRNPQ